MQNQPSKKAVLSDVMYTAKMPTPFRAYLVSSSLFIVLFIFAVGGLGLKNLWNGTAAHANEVYAVREPDTTEKLNALETATATNVLSQAVLIPQAIPNRPKQESLQQIVDHWRTLNRQTTAGVVVQEIGGQNRSATLNANRQMYAASLYKLYLIDYLYNRIEQGKLNANAALTSGGTVSSCIDAMVLVSDNVCAQAVANMVGWGAASAFAKSRGFVGTNLTNADIGTTAADTAAFLKKLQAGQLMSYEHTGHLLSLMKNQKLRQAIPEGAPGAVVADKVGFYGIYWHDAGIVYGSSSTFVISVLTQNGSAAQIADLTNQIYQFLQG